MLEKTIKRGFVFAPEVIANCDDLDKLIKIVENEIGLTPEKMNQTFHKSWEKVVNAPMIQLVIEQMIYYITTYGFKELGVYNENSVYIPNEKLDIPEIENIKLTVINGYTVEELKEKLIKLLSSGIALKEDTLKDVIDVAMMVEIKEEEIEQIKNKEAKVMLYDYFNLVPKNSTEFLRYLIFKATGKFLLIKNSQVIEEIKECDVINITGLFVKYENKNGLDKLAEIFYRFKPLFLAFRLNKSLKKKINKIRRLAVKNHKPLREDYLNTITYRNKHEIEFNIDHLKNELNRANIWRKIRLAYALKFRTVEPKSILYKIKNGKGYAKEFSCDNIGRVQSILDIVMNSIITDIDVKDKKIYIPENINYTLPVTEKQFTGNFPSGSYITIQKNMVVGIYWENVKNNIIDLDLSMIDNNGNKIGWDSNYRNEEKSILFSGDITDAPNGATELFYVAKQKELSGLMFVNYYNYDKDIEVPFKIVIAKKEDKEFNKDYMIDPNNMITVAKSSINQKQKILGLLTTTEDECRFYFTETSIGKNISSSGNEFVEHVRNYLFYFYQNTISLKEVLQKAGAIFVEKEECEIDLSPENLEKDTIINLL